MDVRDDTDGLAECESDLVPDGPGMSDASFHMDLKNLLQGVAEMNSAAKDDLACLKKTPVSMKAVR